MKKLSSILHPLSLLYAVVSFAATLVPLLLLSLWERVGIALPAIVTVAGAAATFAIMLGVLRGTPRVSAVFFSLCYAFATNTLVYATESARAATVILLFPLVMTGVHIAVTHKNGILFALALAAALATADNLAYITLLSSVLFFVYYLITEKSARSVKAVSVYLVSFTGGILMSLPFLLPVLRSLDLSAYFESSSDIPYKALPSKLFPAAFDTVGSMGTPFLYCGILTLLFLPVFFAQKEICLTKKLSFTLLFACPLLLSLSPRTMPLFLLLGDLDAFRFPAALPFVFALTVAAEEGFTRYTEKKTSVLYYSAAGTVLFALVAEKLKAEPPITAAETARTVMHDPSSVFITLFVTAILLCGVYLLSEKKKRAGVAVLSVALILEYTAASLFLLPLVTEECDSYYPTASETHTVSHDYAGDILADVADEMFYFFRDDATGSLGNVGDFGNIFGESDADISAFFATFGAVYKDGRLMGSTPVLDALCGITYTIGDDSGVAYGLSEYIGDTDRKKPIYENLFVLPVGMTVQSAVLDGLPENDDPFRNMNEFLTLLTGKATTVFHTLTPKEQNGVYIYQTSESTIWLCRNGCVEAVDVNGGSLRIENEGKAIFAAVLDARATKDILSDLYTRSFTPYTLENGMVSGNIFVSANHRLLLTSLPYSAGFTVDVDGIEVATRNVSGLLAVPITELGYHRVILRFTPLPRAKGETVYDSFGYMAVGVIVTLLPVLAELGVATVRRCNTKKKESEDAVCKE